MTKRLHPLLAVAILGLGACAQPTAPSLSTTGVSAVEGPRYEVQAASPITGLETAILARINVERRRHGLAPVTFSPAMRQLARQHSRDMSAHHYFGHTDLKGQVPYKRMERSGIPFESYGETESHRPMGGNTLEDAIADWYKHPVGKKYMLSKDFTQAGVGVYRAGNFYDITVEYRRP